MKKSIYVIAAVAMLFLCGCTQFDGHIGPIFGSWALREITEEDGSRLELQYETVFSFQNEVVQVVRLDDPPFRTEAKYGNFKVTKEKLTLKFQAQPTESGSYLYVTPDWLYFPEDGEPIVFDIKKLNGSDMDLVLDTGGRRLEYKLEKTW